MSQSIRVVLADDHPVVRHGLAAIVDVEDDIDVVGQAENGEEAIALVHAHQPQVVLMDLMMPVLDGVAAIQRLKVEAPQVQVIILTTFADDETIYDGIAAGARGYLLKDAPPDQLIEAIRAAARGESLLDTEVAARILDRFSSMLDRDVSPVSDQALQKSPKLTPRELDVLTLMVQGARNKEIAGALVISERTVKIHVGNILGKLEVDNRTEAVAVAIRLGLVDIEL